MTNTQTPVEELEGRNLDAAVAREVFGLDVRGPEEYREYWIYGESPFAYQFRSTDSDRGGNLNGVPYFCEEWGPAGRVVEDVHATDENINLSLTRSIYGHWSASFVFGGRDEVQADTAPLAICRAALRAVRD